MLHHLCFRAQQQLFRRAPRWEFAQARSIAKAMSLAGEYLPVGTDDTSRISGLPCGPDGGSLVRGVQPGRNSASLYQRRGTQGHPAGKRAKRNENSSLFPGERITPLSLSVAWRGVARRGRACALPSLAGRDGRARSTVRWKTSLTTGRSVAPSTEVACSGCTRARPSTPRAVRVHSLND